MCLNIYRITRSKYNTETWMITVKCKKKNKKHKNCFEKFTNTGISLIYGKIVC